MARYCLGRPGWHEDLRHGQAMARSRDPMTYSTVVGYVYFAGIPLGVLTPDDHVLGEIEDALRIARRSGDDMALVLARATLGIALAHRPTDAELSEGRTLLAEVGEALLHRRHNLSELRLIDVYLARDGAIPLMFDAVDRLIGEGQLLSWGVPATGVLVEALLDRGADGDVAAAETAIERLAIAAAEDVVAVPDIWLLRLRALLPLARGDDALDASRALVSHYRAVANSLGFDGHVNAAAALSLRA